MRNGRALFGAAVVGAALLLTPSLSLAADGAALLAGNCAQCHDLKGPAPATTEGARARKGPDLFYAGVKFQRPWLESWLQDPKRLRPAGYRYWEHLKPSVGMTPDAVDESDLPVHPKLGPAEAKAAADALMALAGNQQIIKKGALSADDVDMFMAEMNFDKFNGCLACHQIEPGYGGLSGPEMYSAGKRLQPDFIYSYLQNPQAWDPKGWMPDKQLGENNLQTLSKYVIKLAEEGK